MVVVEAVVVVVAVAVVVVVVLLAVGVTVAVCCRWNSASFRTEMLPKALALRGSIAPVADEDDTSKAEAAAASGSDVVSESSRGCRVVTSAPISVIGLCCM